MLGKDYAKSKDLVKKEVGHIRNGEPQDYKDIFDFDKSMDDGIRRKRLEKLFLDHILPFVDKSLTKKGIKYLAEKGEISLLPAIKAQLETLV